MTQVNIHKGKKKTHGHGKLTWGCQGGKGGSGMDWEYGVSRCKLLHLEWISKQETLSSLYWWNMMDDNMKKRMYLYV